MAQIGEKLREAREEKGLSLEEVEDALKIRKAHLANLEEDAFDALPGGVQARGFLRNYARYLGLDVRELLEAYEERFPSPGARVRGRKLSDDGIEFLDVTLSPRSFSLFDFAIGFMIICAFLGAAFLFVYERYVVPAAEATPTPKNEEAAVRPTEQESAFIIPTATPPPTATPTPTLTPTPLYYVGVTIELEVVQRSWVQVLVDDVKVYEGVLEEGANPSWTGEKRVAVRAGNAGGVKVTVNGQQQGLMGLEGQVEDMLWEKMEPGAPVTTPTPTPDLFATPGVFPLDTPASPVETPAPQEAG